MDLLYAMGQMKAFKVNKEEKENEPCVMEKKEDYSGVFKKKIEETECRFESTSDPKELYGKYIKFMKKKNIQVSTITLNCKLYTKIKLKSLAKYLVLDHDEVEAIFYGDPENPETNRSIIPEHLKKKPKKKKQEKQKVAFYNQATVLMRPSNPDDNDPNRTTESFMNIKIFRNGSLQVTGCKEIAGFMQVAQRLINRLKKGNNKKSYLYYNKDIKIIGFKVNMINSSFKLDIKVNREKLYHLLKKNHNTETADTEIGPVIVDFDPSGGHSSVNITHRYYPNNGPTFHEIFIYVFQTGSIVVTGAKNLQQIISSYFYLQKILEKYHEHITIVNLKFRTIQKNIKKFFELKKAGKI